MLTPRRLAETRTLGPVDLGVDGLGHASEIGAGASAIVYRARQLDLDREVAVKVLSVTDEAFVRRFRREAKTLGKLSQNPGIVTVYDTGVTASGQPYLILELCNESLLDQLKAQQTFEPLAACRIMAEVSDAVNDAHQNGVIHRDIKPGNVLISQKGRYMVTDFGISTVTGSTQPHTQTSSIGFTAGYVAPETLTGDDVSTPSDVYSLGATLFHMIAGKAPFVGEGNSSNLLALAQRVVSDPVPDLRPNGVPETICRIIESAMAKTPADRPTAGQLRDQLLAAIADTKVTSVGAITGLDDITTAVAAPAGPAGPGGLALDGATTSMDADEVLALQPPATASMSAGPGPVDTAHGSDATIATGPAILNESAAPAAVPPRSQAPIRYEYGAEDRPTLPWIIGGGIAFVAALALGLFLLSRGGDDSGENDEVATVDGPTTSVGDGNEQFGNDDDVGNRGSLSPGEAVGDDEETTETTTVDTIDVPDVVGDSQTAATSVLQGLGFTVNPVIQESATVPAGSVISQDPVAGTELEDGAVITIFVSGTVGITVDVPPLVGLTQTEAEAALEAVGLTAVVSAEFDPNSRLQQVLSSTPTAAEEVPADSAVTIVVSQGPDCATLPGVTGTAAETRLRDAGYTVTTNTESSATVESGDVIRCTQQPAAATATLIVASGTPPPVDDPCAGAIGRDPDTVAAELVALGHVVQRIDAFNETVAPGLVADCVEYADSYGVLTSLGPLPADCDSVVGMTEAAARAALPFATIRSTTTASATVPAGSVISCAITNTVEADLTVSSGPAQTDIVVPNVAAQPTVAAAFTALETAGFTRGARVETPSVEPAGTILGTNPAAGTSHPNGTTVNVLVSDGSVRIPANIVGQTEAQATARLTNLGLTVTVADGVAAGPAQVGLVQSVTPAAGSLVKPGAAVTITVGRAAPDPGNP